MKNVIVTITGQKGSGKTSFARFLLARTSSAVVLDRLGHDYTQGAIARDFESAADYFLARRFQNQRLICRFAHDPEWAGILRLVYESQKFGLKELGDKLPPITVFIEEIDFFSNRAYIDPFVAQMYKYGRHYSINLVGIVRQDVETHPLVRANSDIIVAFRHIKLSVDFLRFFSSEDQVRLAGLEQYNPTLEPALGTHYLTYPPDSDVLAAWGDLAEPLTQTEITP